MRKDIGLKMISADSWIRQRASDFATMRV